MNKTEKALVACTATIVLTMCICVALLWAAIQRAKPYDPVMSHDVYQLRKQLEAIEAHTKASAKTLSDMDKAQSEERFAASQRAWIERAGK